jgi:peptidoglycan/LPS O-acetylase OafA/YrhL
VPPSFIDFLDGGRTAVSLFFVLSGFILAYNYANLRGGHERLKFYASRIARIYPVVLLSVAIGAVGVAYAALTPQSGAMLDWYALKDPSPMNLGGSLLTQLTMTVGWFPTASLNQPWNPPAWSIACEMFFYALFPALIVWLRRMRFRGIAGLMVGLFAFQCAAIWAARSFAPSGARGFLVSQFPLTHLFEFVIGIAVALLYLRGAREWLSVGRRRLALLITAAAPLVALAAYRPVDPAYLLMSPLFAAIVLGLAVPAPSILDWKPFVLLGEASFSLYLIHVPLMNLYSIAYPNAVVGWALFAATIGASVLVFKFYETPARRGVRRLLLQRGRAARKQPAQPETV